MFLPQYTITHRLLENIKKISIIINNLNNTHFPDVIQVEFEKRANSLSAHASTSIEGNPLPLTEVRKILKSHPRHIRDSEREVLNYNNALKKLNAPIKKRRVKFDLPFILKLHKEIMEGLLDKFRCGKLREEPVFVNDPREGQPIYLPPDHGDVPKLVSELINFVDEGQDELDALIMAGIFHKQCVIIHPFIDGNGRTTRLATKAILANMGLDTFNLFSFENYYNRNVSQYFKKVGVTGNYYEIANKMDFTEWLEYFSDGIIDELLRVEKELKVTTATPETTIKPYHATMIDHIKSHGFITDNEYSKLVNRAKATRNLDFNKLISMKLIEKTGKGKSTYYKLKRQYP
ncbi:MAG: hypothetical protein A3I75_04490 [Deltaproteobacteria bacterium RIFCSPLOWO2_02_FULL_50_16]|nr:MAG: hypothetical protein A3I75_04490 [Deltaproteobacteria bacterium RIFCSPLOWO2_02_FULL_50_16]